MSDTIEQIGSGSVIQHVRLNDRVYLMKLKKEDLAAVLQRLEVLTVEKHYSKLFCKVPGSLAAPFLAMGFIPEGEIPHFYDNGDDALFLSRFDDPARLANKPEVELRRFRQLLSETLHPKEFSQKTAAFAVIQLEQSHARQIADLYARVFLSYPFPIYDPAYIVKMMEDDVQYFGAFSGDQLAALSSADIDFETKSAEMTDFATHDTHTGHNLSCLLLHTMEQAMQQQGIRTLYTIARLASVPMNKTFLRSGYHYSGTFINNTHISGHIESMNLYYKHL
ncbi:MAG: putative beta-lysine N-acetyltransferase [Bacteroidetes bacterium GWD2_45_23]|nr:MAG: putative beta-lysine N-acetyltransferase [Bacteroidetes bacterium GWC2_46_850]OFX80990.1 MAG: putative beta-lysine N-acetyltransferase [Bacteroidetes bacterium GWC1_47_7]OFX82530.1 MAG: putative beta-lysine N-acetyltransferase [Bacteroidetes bacterium GWD2_45_23]HAR38475.1 putative beta-lysine N-acetyltransferase [Porphyromonadaceae bacterium]HBB01189.1 putative beta-lysine N-acetyltransferase [Porphyromonadaceae bacterium]